MLTSDQISAIENIFLLLVQKPPQAPPGLTVAQAENYVWNDLAKLLTGEELKPVLAIEDRNQKLLALNLRLLKKFQSDKVASIPENLDKLVEDYTKAKQEKHQEAQAKVAQKPSIHEQVNQALEKYRANLSKTSETTAQATQYVQEPLQTDVIITPEQALSEIDNFSSQTAAIDNPPYTAIESAIDLAPITTSAVDTSQTISNLHILIKSQLPAETIPDTSANNIAGAITTMRLIDPSAPAEKYVRLVTKLELIEEAATGKPIKIPPQVIEEAVVFDTSVSGEKLVHQTLTSEFVKSGASPLQARELATSFRRLQIPQTAQFIAKFAPTPPNSSPAQKQKIEAGVFSEISRAAAYLGATPAQQFINHKFFSQVDWIRVYSTVDQVYPPQEQQQNVNRWKSQPNQTLNFVFGQGKSYIQDEGTNLALNIIKAGGVTAWVMRGVDIAFAIPNDMSVEMAKQVLQTVSTKEEAAALGQLFIQQGNKLLPEQLTKQGLAQIMKSAGQAGGTAAKGAATVAGEVAAEGTATTAGSGLTAFLIGLGIPAGLVGWIVAAVVFIGTFIATHIKPIWNWLKRTFSGIVKFLAVATGAIIGGLLGAGAAFAAGFPVAFGLAGGAGAGLLIQQTGGIGPALQTVAGGVARASTALVSLAVVEIATPVIVIALSIPIAVTLILFIINSGAYIVPSSSGITYIGPGGAYPKCWPVVGTITQGPPGSGSDCGGICSHVQYNENAFDIGGALDAPVYATHDGLASAYITDPNRGYGIYVRVVSSVGSFSTIYGHLNSVTDIFLNGPVVIPAGTQIGSEDSTGNSTGNHVHYELISTPPYIINSIVPPCSLDGSNCTLNGVPQWSTTDKPPTCYANLTGGGGTPPITP